MKWLLGIIYVLGSESLPSGRLGGYGHGICPVFSGHDALSGPFYVPGLFWHRLGHTKVLREMRTILKFDTGADGFKKMMVVLGVTAVVILAVGIYFITMVMNEMRQM